MRFNVLGNSVTGYKNLVRGSKSQDYIDYKEEDKYIICSVADGHSTPFFKHSLDGAKFACEASIDVLSENFDMDIEKLEEKLINYEIQKKIESRWRSLVEEHYKKNYPNVFKIEYIKYSTTLLSVLITDSFILYLKLGDGDIVLKSKDEYKVVINTRNNLTVDSLGREGEYRHIMYSLEKIEENYLIENLVSKLSDIIEHGGWSYEKGFDEICLIVDRDKESFISKPGNDQYKYVLDRCLENGFRFCVTNPCFEFWLLMHSDKVLELDKDKLLNNSKVTSKRRYAEDELRKIYSGYKKSSYHAEEFVKNIDIAIKNEKEFCEDIQRLKDSIGSNIGILIEDMRS